MRVSATVADLEREFRKGSAAAHRFADDLERVDGRMSGIVQTGLALGPALVPVMAGSAVAAAGLATSLGAVVVGAGAMALAFSGVGDALDAVNAQQLDPSVENFEKMQAALTELGPAGEQFVRYLQSLRPELDGLQSIARQGLFPGVEEGIEQVREQLPLLEDIVGNVSQAMGDLAAEGGEALSGPFWTQFLEFVRDDAASALEGMARGFGNIAEGVAGLSMSLDPVADDFGGALLRMSEDFARWGREVGETQGFREFVDYIRGITPQMGDTLGSIANALVQLGQAAAPISGPVLQAIAGIADAIAAIANLPVVGPALIGAAAGVAALSRAVALWNATGMASIVTGLRGVDAEGKKASATMAGVGRAGVALVGVGLAAAAIDDLAESLYETTPGLNDLQNRLLDLGGGRTASLGAEFNELGAYVERLAAPKFTDQVVDNFNNVIDVVGEIPNYGQEAERQIGALDAALAQIATTKGPEAARQAFQELARAQGLTAQETRQLVGLLPMYREALEGVGSDADLAAEGLSAAERAAQNLNNEMARLTGMLSRRQAWRGFEEAIDAVNKAVKENGRTLDQNTAKGRANGEVLDNIAASGVAVAESLHGIARVRVMQRTREEFIAAARQMGQTRGEARQLADSLGLVDQKGKIQILLRESGMDDATQKLRRVKEAADRVPKRIDARVEGNTGDAQRDLGVVANKMQQLDRQTANPRASLRDEASPKISAADRLLNELSGSSANPTARLNDQASGQLGRVTGLLAALDGRTATTYVRTVHIVEGRGGTPIRLPEADGGVVDYYAHGGLREQHRAQIAPAGAWRVWAEPETGGEAYIPLAQSKRPQSIDIWEEAGRRLGVRFARFAEGGFTETEQNRALRQFRIGDDVSSMRSELRDLTRTLREELGRSSPLLRSVDRLGGRLLTNARQQQRLERVNERLTDNLRDLRSDRRQLASSVASNFLSAEAFQGGAEDLSLWLRAERNDARAITEAQRRLRRRGASDALVRGVGEEGNVALAQELSRMSRRELNQYDRLIAQRGRAARQAGDVTAQIVLGDELRNATRATNRSERAMNRNTRQMERLGRSLERRVDRGRGGGANRRARSRS